MFGFPGVRLGRCAVVSLQISSVFAILLIFCDSSRPGTKLRVRRRGLRVQELRMLVMVMMMPLQMSLLFAVAMATTI
jgi:hypothetical protein